MDKAFMHINPDPAKQERTFYISNTFNTNMVCVLFRYTDNTALVEVKGGHTLLVDDKR